MLLLCEVLSYSIYSFDQYILFLFTRSYDAEEETFSVRGREINTRASIEALITTETK